MKNFRSSFLKAVAAFMMGFPIFYAMIAGIWFNVPFGEFAALLISPFYYFVCFFAILTGFGLWEMKRWAWYIFIFFQFLLFYQNANVVANYSESEYRLGAFLGATLFQLLVAYQITKEVRVPYFLPKIRWWASYLEDTPTIETKIKRQSGEFQVGEVLDVSVYGCFVKTSESFEENESVSLRFDVKGEEFECQGWVVWRSESAVTHPKGIGIKFEKLSRRIRKSLKQALSDYNKDVNEAQLSSMSQG